MEKIITIDNNIVLSSTSFEKSDATKLIATSKYSSCKSITASFLSSAVFSPTIKSFLVDADIIASLPNVYQLKLSDDVKNTLVLNSLYNVQSDKNMLYFVIGLGEDYMQKNIESFSEQNFFVVVIENMLKSVFDNVGCNKNDLLNIKLKLEQQYIFSYYLKRMSMQNGLDKIFVKGSNKAVNYDSLLVLLLSYACCSVISEKAKMLASLVDVNSLDNYFNEMLQFDGKSRVLTYEAVKMACKLCGEKFAKKIIADNMISEKSSNWHIGIIDLLNRNDNIEVLRLLLYKHLLQKDTCRNRNMEYPDLVYLATKYNYVVLSSNAEATIDYGDKKFLLKLLTNMKFEIFDITNNKIVRTLPKANIYEDEKLVGRILSEYDLLKRQINDISSIRKHKIKLMLEKGEQISYREYSSYFTNPITQKLAQGILWGVFDIDDNLLRAFRTVDKYTCEDIDGNKFSLNNTDRISVVDASFLSLEQIKKWKLILWGEKKPQLVRQFEAPIHYVSLDKLNSRYVGLENSSPKNSSMIYLTSSYDNARQKRVVDRVWVKGKVNTSHDRRLLNRAIIRFDSELNPTGQVEEIIKEGNLQRVKWAIEQELITTDNIASFLQVAINEKNAEIISYLMQIKKEWLGDVADLDWEI